MKKSNLLLKTLLPAVFSVMLLTVASAQDEPMAPGQAPVLPVPGYVIYSNGDTVWGKLTWSLKYVENNPVEI
jgi:ABC-type sugar transport system substrate-binding protein